mgnify:CR=1 FL=1
MRFIPGYAGNANTRLVCQRFHAVYPRLRGERFRKFLNVAKILGLSPATRGTPETWRRCGEQCRFIPGYAGNAGQAGYIPAKMSVYPRLRGEREQPSTPTDYAPGLSPATRGTPIPHNNIEANCRFIPGYAGNARNFTVTSPVAPVYPRLRGERIEIIFELF